MDAPIRADRENQKTDADDETEQDSSHAKHLSGYRRFGLVEVIILFTTPRLLTFFSVRCEKNPICWPSGDQNA